MLKCWHESPTQRPTFTELVKEFDSMLVSLSDKVSKRNHSCFCNLILMGRDWASSLKFQ